MKNMDTLVSKSEAWLQYAVRLNLLHEKKEDLIEARRNALQDEKIQDELASVAGFHSSMVSNHKNPGLPLHRLLFLLDIGFDRDVPEIQCAVDAILKHKDEFGIYQSLGNYPVHFGGSGKDTFGWALCDAPLLLLALLRANVDYESLIKPGFDHLVSLFRQNGFPCTVSKELGKFRGPGRKDDCCPYATLIMLKLFAENPACRNSDLTAATAEALLVLWENSLQVHPYLFYMGTDFRKLKAPAIWYDIVSVADVLTRFDHLKNDPRLLAMLSIIKDKQDKDGFFTPESVYLKYKNWDFGQKKEPSAYLTYLCTRLLQRAGM